MKRIFAILAALCLFWTMPAAAAAQGSPTLICGQEGNNTSLTLEGLEETVYALQLELTLQGACPDAVFVSGVPGAYVPSCRTEVRGDTTFLTVYMTAPEGVLTSESSLYLGTLAAGGNFSLPAQGTLVLLDRSLQPCRGSGPVSLQSRQPSSGGNQAPGSGSGQTPSGGGSGSGSNSGSGQPAVPQLPAAPLPFLDVPEGYWCRDAVEYVYRAGLMNGTSATAFSPTATTTRGMIVTILYRMEGSPAAGISSFTDVPSDAYYANAVAWAAANGIVNGYEDGSFRPEDAITREQMAAFLFRYARYLGQDVSLLADLSAYTDAESISDYAVEPIRWANARGLITGISTGIISPSGSATREQVAVILTRFIQGSGPV
ncbi:MAG: S-layer homology domain-containing protein [Oscillospiraceae bacterium]|nr:S-layer homology domain-containing protein [Oscillospiraceae bacterium]